MSVKRNKLFKSDAIKLAEFLIWLCEHDKKSLIAIKNIIRKSLTVKSFKIVALRRGRTPTEFD